MVLSNGKLVSEEKDPGTGLVAVHWSQDKPHANYLVSLLAGYFKKVEDQYKDMPLAFYTPASQINEAATSFRDTKDMMAFFEQEIGVPYPWAKYYQVCVNDFVAGGMENTSITTLTDRHAVHSRHREYPRQRGAGRARTGASMVRRPRHLQGLEPRLAKRRLRHVLRSSLRRSQKRTRRDALWTLRTRRDFLTGLTTLTRSFAAISTRRTSSLAILPIRKAVGSCTCCASQLGEELYRQCIKTYLERHQYGNVVTEDLNAVIEELSGRSYDQFFDQWVYHAHHPELEVNYVWDEKTKLARLTIRQTQKLSENVLLFSFPLTVRFKSKAGVVDRLITVKEKDEDFYFPLASAPEIVRLDPEFSLLAKINFNVPNPMLYAQLADRGDVVGRLIAVARLGKMTRPRGRDKAERDGQQRHFLRRARGSRPGPAVDSLRRSLGGTASASFHRAIRCARPLRGGCRHSRVLF